MNIASSPLVSRDEVVADDAADASHSAEKRPVRAKSTSKRAAKPLAAPGATAPVNRPFSMSYDGVSSRQYLEQTLVRRQN